MATPAWSRDHHYSFWSDNPQKFLTAIRNSEGVALPPVPAGKRVCGGIVTHHFLASGLMARFFAELSRHGRPKTIILLGPNHFHRGLRKISVSGLPWRTSFGELAADRALAQRMAAAMELPEDNDAFAGEHSVGVLMPFVKYYFPKSLVVPVLVDVNARSYQLRRLREVLYGALKAPDTLLLLGMDFSHDTRAEVAEARDGEARAVISSLDAEGTKGLRVDSRKGLQVLLASMREAGCGDAWFYEHTNSAQLTRNPEQTNVTSYFTVYFLRKEAGKTSSEGF